MFATLERTKITGLNQARRELADKASSVLGYTKLSNTIGSSLLDTLATLGITPFTSSSVEKYKASKVRFGLWRSQKLALFFFVMSFVGMYACSLFAHAATVAVKDSFNEGFCGTSAVVLALLVLITLCVSVPAVLFESAHGHGDTRLITDWNTMSLASFDGTVPEFVLMKAVQIKEANPNVSFQVDYLLTSTNTHTVVRRDPDPFLIVELEAERYYIEVWDEKEYEKTL